MGQSISTISTIIPSVPGWAVAGFFQSISFLLLMLQWGNGLNAGWDLIISSLLGTLDHEGTSGSG